MTRREDLLQQLEQIEDADDAEELIKEAWGEARKEALDYEQWTDLKSRILKTC